MQPEKQCSQMLYALRAIESDAEWMDRAEASAQRLCERLPSNECTWNGTLP
jgi:hypothetical protein